MALQNGKKRTCTGCSVGCLGIMAAAVGLIAAIYPTRGHYRPYIPPAPPPPRLNAYDDYIAAGKILNANGGLKAIETAEKENRDYDFYYDGLKTGRIRPGAKPVPKPPPDIKLVKQHVVAMNQPALARIRQGMTKQCQIPITRGSGSGASLYDVRKLAEVLKLESEGHLLKGEYGQAFGDSLDILRLGYDIAHGGNLYHIGVNSRLSEIACRIAAESINGLTLPDCIQFELIIRKIMDSRCPVSAAAQEEGWFALSRLMVLDDKAKCDSSGIYMVRSYGGLSVASTRNCWGPADKPDLVDKGVMALGRACWHAERDAILKDVESYFHVLTSEADKPAAFRKPLPKLERYIEQQHVNFTNSTLRQVDTALARVRLTYCMLRLRRFYLESHRLPISLANLGIPRDYAIDPFSGKPFIYQPNLNGYLLYSVGPDLKDDGGVPMPAVDDEMSGDIGVIASRRIQDPVTQRESYSLVPHMNPPKPLPGVQPAIQQ